MTLTGDPAPFENPADYVRLNPAFQTLDCAAFVGGNLPSGLGPIFSANFAEYPGGPGVVIPESVGVGLVPNFLGPGAPSVPGIGNPGTPFQMPVFRMLTGTHTEVSASSTRGDGPEPMLTAAAADPPQPKSSLFCVEDAEDGEILGSHCAPQAAMGSCGTEHGCEPRVCPAIEFHGFRQMFDASTGEGEEDVLISSPSPSGSNRTEEEAAEPPSAGESQQRPWRRRRPPNHPPQADESENGDQASHRGGTLPKL